MFRILLLFFLISISGHLVYGGIVCDGKPVWGRVERVIFLEKDKMIDAKIDTGAAMSSLSATDINVFKQDNKKWVKFTVYFSKSKENVVFIKPVIATIKILKRQEENTNSKIKNYSTRLVVQFKVKVGDQEKLIPVNLVNRSHFRYSMLIGKDALEKFGALVNVNQQYTTLLK